MALTSYTSVLRKYTNIRQELNDAIVSLSEASTDDERETRNQRRNDLVQERDGTLVELKTRFSEANGAMRKRGYPSECSSS